MKNVGIRYDQGPEILKDINLTLTQGSFHFLPAFVRPGFITLLFRPHGRYFFAFHIISPLLYIIDAIIKLIKKSVQLKFV